jgi:hypothetical protein
LSTLAGSYRVGFFVGPFAAAAAVGVLGTDGAYLVSMAAGLLAGVTLALAPDVRSPGPGGPDSPPPTRDVVGGVVRSNLATLRTLGVAVAFTGALRAGVSPR